jgi:cysteine desulfurase/selenocysteine lyase
MAQEMIACIDTVDLHQCKMVDVQNIYHHFEPRNLRAAYRFYCGGKDFENAHTAEADTLATYEVLKSQLDRYENPTDYQQEVLKNDVDSMSKIGPRTKIVSVTHVSNVLGTANDVASIAAAAHAQGATVVVDAAQSAPHVKVDVRELGVDLLCFSAHKLLGPLGIGVLWGRPELLDAMPPFLTGGEMIDTVTETGAVWSQVPQKFEAGTQDAAGAYATDAALSYMESIGLPAIEERERLLARYLTDALNSLDYVTIVGSADGTAHVGAVSFDVRGVHPHDVASILDMKGVCIRAGHHCAQPLLTYLGWHSTCRASVAFYNDKHDIDRLVDALDTVWGIFHGRD